MMLKYYKLINNSEFIGIGTTFDLRRFQTKHRILLTCDESEAQYIECNNLLYRDLWMVPESTDIVKSVSVSIIEIDKNEYDILHESMKTGERIVIQPEAEEPVNSPVVDANEVITVEFVKSSKISEMNSACNKAIVKGFDATLNDGETYHFSLTTQDQLNMITLSELVEMGENSIPYHADGELCKFYSAEDVKVILKGVREHKTYHVSYFNALKAYVESLSTIEEIRYIEYGVEIPEEHQTDVLKSLLT